MDILLIYIAISIIPLSLLAIHIWRDIRGRERNNLGLCYSCGFRYPNTEPIYHDRGGVYRYCPDYAKKHNKLKRIALCFMGLAIAMTMGVLAVVNFETEQLKATYFAIEALLVVIAVAITVFHSVRRN